MSSEQNIRYKIIKYDDLYNYKKGKNKSFYYKKMKEIYDLVCNNDFDFKDSTHFKNDISILMYNNDILIGYIFIKDNLKEIDINEPIFYNFIIDNKYQNLGYGTILFNHIKQLYMNNSLYCFIDIANKRVIDWYIKRGGLSINNSKCPSGYILYKFDNR